jgi:hypothetical protein
LHGIIIKRATALSLGDIIINPPFFIDGKLMCDSYTFRVTGLRHTGDDVHVWGDDGSEFSTSDNNRVIVYRSEDTEVKQADPELERMLDRLDKQ